MTGAELALRRRIFSAFADTGAPPAVEHHPGLRALVRDHVVVLSDDGGGLTGDFWRLT